MPRVLKIILAVCLTAGLVISAGVWWTTRARGEPQAQPFAAATIGPDLKSATVLALGEATHGTHEFQQLRLQLVQKLPAFRAIVIEEDYGCVSEVNDYLQGGRGTAEQAARRFGFVLNHTGEMADLLAGIRKINDRRAAADRIQMVGMDVQRVDASKRIALAALQQVAPDTADKIESELTNWTDESGTPDEQARLRSAVDHLVRELTTADGVPTEARDAAVALQQNLTLNRAPSYAATRAKIMTTNLKRTVAAEAARGNMHTLLFAHDGHVDKTSASFPHADLGKLAARKWGDRYRVIGTDLHHARVITGEREHRWTVTMTNPSPLRGIFAHTDVGYLDFAEATPTNAALLNKPVRMASAGESFHQWQAWVPWFNSVRMTPASSYDALIMVDDGTPVVPLPG